jgi:hypothetical protein
LTPILYPIARKWKEVELWKYKHKTKEVIRDKCIPLGIKDDNAPPKFVVQVENTSLKDHNSYKSGLENIKLYGTYGDKGNS